MILLAKTCNILLKYWIFCTSSVLVVVADQLSKLWVLHNIPAWQYIHPIPVIKGFLYWVHVHNTGAAWSILEGRQFLLCSLALVTLATIILFRKTFNLANKNVQLFLGIFWAGVLGNLIDRLRLGYVVDFIDIHLPGYRWPSFNIADAAIVAGIMGYTIWIYKPKNN